MSTLHTKKTCEQRRMDHGSPVWSVSVPRHVAAIKAVISWFLACPPPVGCPCDILPFPTWPCRPSTPEATLIYGPTSSRKSTVRRKLMEWKCWESRGNLNGAVFLWMCSPERGERSKEVLSVFLSFSSRLPDCGHDTSIVSFYRSKRISSFLRHPEEWAD